LLWRVLQCTPDSNIEYRLFSRRGRSLSTDSTALQSVVMIGEPTVNLTPASQERRWIS
jgi:hypothetical protein